MLDLFSPQGLCMFEVQQGGKCGYNELEQNTETYEVRETVEEQVQITQSLVVHCKDLSFSSECDGKATRGFSAGELYDLTFKQVTLASLWRIAVGVKGGNIKIM